MKIWWKILLAPFILVFGVLLWALKILPWILLAVVIIFRGLLKSTRTR